MKTNNFQNYKKKNSPRNKTNNRSQLLITRLSHPPQSFPLFTSISYRSNRHEGQFRFDNKSCTQTIGTFSISDERDKQAPGGPPNR